MKIRSIILVIFLFTIASFIHSCNRQGKESHKAGEQIPNVVEASVETESTMHGKNVDSSDDPAIWINRKNPANSFIIGTDKKGGLAIYDLAGQLLNYYPTGDMNNCDLRYGFALNDTTIDILAASNRTCQYTCNKRYLVV